MNTIIFNGSGIFHIAFRSVGAHRIATELRNNNISCKVIDYFSHCQALDQDFFKKCIKKYVNDTTIWIGFSSTFCNEVKYNKEKNLFYPCNDYRYDGTNFISDEDYLWFKKNYPYVKIIIGGAKSNKDYKIADFYVEGYADSSILELTKYFQRKLSTVQINNNRITYDKKASTFDFYNSSTRYLDNDYIESHEVLVLEVSRGCIFKCAFCNYPLNGKKKFDYIRNANVLLDDLITNYNKYGVTKYLISDDTFNDSTEKLTFLYENVFSKLPFKIQIGAYIRLDLVAAHPEQIDLLKKLGLICAFFGVESLNRNATKVVGKGMNPELVIPTLKKFREKIPEMSIGVGVIIGLPNDTELNIRSWLDKLVVDDSPIDALTMNALGISNTTNKEWRSDFEKDFAKYGYYDVDKNTWKNKVTGMTKEIANKIVRDYLQKSSSMVDRAEGFVVLQLMNLGYELEFVRNTSLKYFYKNSDVSVKKLQKYMNQILEN